MYLCPSHGLSVEYLNSGRTEAYDQLACLLPPVTSVPGHIPFCPQTLSGSPLRKRSSNWLLHRRKPEQGGGRGGRLDLHQTILFPHPPGEGTRASPPIYPLTNLVLTPLLCACVCVCARSGCLSVCLAHLVPPPCEGMGVRGWGWGSSVSPL